MERKTFLKLRTRKRHSFHIERGFAEIIYPSGKEGIVWLNDFERMIYDAGKAEGVKEGYSEAKKNLRNWLGVKEG